MTWTTLLKGTVVFLIVLTTFSTNLDDNLLARLGLPTSYAASLLAALGCTLLLSARHALVVGLVVVFSLNANMPQEFTLNFGIDRDFYVGFMLALLFQPALAWTLDINPVG